MEQSNRRNHLFLLELIFSIFFFIVCTTVCIMIFVNAHLLSEKTKHTNHAVSISQNIAEIFLGVNGDFEALKSFYPDASTDKAFSDISVSDSLIHHFDKNQMVSVFFDDKQGIIPYDEKPAYCALICHQYENEISSIIIQVFSIKPDENNQLQSIYSIQIDQYIGETIS